MALTPRWWAFWAAVLGMPMIIFFTLKAFPQWDSLQFANTFHFYVVSGTAVAAMVACAVVVGLTKSLRETRLLFLGLAFLSIAAVFSVHGLGHSRAHPFAGGG